MHLPNSLRKLIDELSELPSIGPRQATRLALTLLSRGRDVSGRLAEALKDIEKIKICESCFFVYENNGALCSICASPAREKNTIMIVEKETDLISIENTGRFKGAYLVLGAVPKTGLLETWQTKRLGVLRTRIAALPGAKAKEIILGFNPTALGDFHAAIISRDLAPQTLKLSRLGRGLPQGGEIEFADDETLGSALDSRS